MNIIQQSSEKVNYAILTREIVDALPFSSEWNNGEILVLCDNELCVAQNFYRQSDTVLLQSVSGGQQFVAPYSEIQIDGAAVAAALAGLHAFRLRADKRFATGWRVHNTSIRGGGHASSSPR